MSGIIHVDSYQQLMLANDLFPLFHSGDKRVTCRKGQRDIKLDDLAFISTDPVQMNDEWDVYTKMGGNIYMAQLVSVTEITMKRVEDVTDEEAQADGFGSAQDLFAGMKRFYEDLELTSPLTFVYFDVK